MNILPFLKKTKEEREYFLALILKQNRIGAILFEKTAKGLDVLTSSDQEQKNLQSLTDEELIEASDAVISTVEKSLPPHIDLKKTIFAIPYTWQDEGKIKPENLTRLKKVCQELDLTPVGFIVSIEAMIHALQQKEGASLSALFVEVEKKEVHVFLVKNGKILQVKNGEWQSSVVDTVEKLLKDIEEVEVLPPRIFLQDDKESHAIQQSFLHHSWPADLPFLHVPQVIVFEKGFENEALIHGVASQMGVEMSFAKQDTQPAEEESVENAIEPVEELEHIDKQANFYKEVDVRFEKAPVEEEKEDKPEASFAQESSSVPTHALPLAEETSEKKESFLKKIRTLAIVGSLKEKMSSISLPSFLGGSNMRLKIGGGIAVGILLLVAFVYSYYAFITRAEIVLFLDKRMVTEEVPVTFSTEDETSVEDAVIRLATTSQELEGSAKQKTTGKKETGEKAKGEVTIYNKTDEPQTIEKGTILSSSNDLEFETLDEVKVASTSSFSTSFSSSKVSVEARKLGKEYNLPSATNFTVESFSSSEVFAKNDSAFSGGSKKELKVVSEKDLADLEEAIEKQLSEKVSSSLSSGESGDTVIPAILATEFVEKKFSKKEGEEAEEVSLSAKLAFEIGRYNEEDLESFAQELTNESIPEGYTYVKDESRIQIEDVEVTEGAMNGVLAVEAVYVPALEVDTLAKDQQRKSKKEVEKQLQELKGVSDVTVILKNQLPLLPALLPFNAKHIIIQTKAHE